MNQDVIHPITTEVLQRLAHTPDVRMRELMSGLVRHLHAFACETRLTDAEWLEAIKFLTAVGQKCDDQRQEFILLSDVLGLSMVVTDMNHPTAEGCTESTVFGPFHVEGAPRFKAGEDIARGASGEPCWVQGRVLGQDREAIPHAAIEVWQADAEGFYDVQRADLQQFQARGVLQADEQGRFSFRSIVPEAYPVPTDGPVGGLLAAMKRHPWRPAHLHFMISAPGYSKLITHVFRGGGEYLDSDVVFGVRDSLIADWTPQAPGHAPDGSHFENPWWLLEFDFVLNREE